MKAHSIDKSNYKINCGSFEKQLHWNIDKNKTGFIENLWVLISINEYFSVTAICLSESFHDFEVKPGVSWLVLVKIHPFFFFSFFKLKLIQKPRM